MKFNSSARFNRKAFNSEKLFDMGIHSGGTVTNQIGIPFPLEEWLYRKEHYIITSGAEQTNHQVRLHIFRSAGIDSGENVYIGTGCESDYDDIRITIHDGETLCDYWIESSDAASAIIWVKIPSLTASGNTKIYIYYGNGSATAVSTTTALLSYCGEKTAFFYDRGNLVGPNNISIHGNITLPAAANIDFVLGLANTNDCAWFDIRNAPGAAEYIVTENEINYNYVPIVSGFDTGTFDLEIRLQTAKAQYYIDAVQKGGDITTYLPDDPIGILFNPEDASHVLHYAFTVQYSDNISHGTWGIEETYWFGSPITSFGFDHTRTIENAPALTTELQMANITATIENSPEVWCSVFIDTTPAWWIPFDTGTSEITVGETVTGDTSGATGTVTTVVIESGTWGGGDAAGYILVEDVSGVFEDGEDLDGTLAGDDAVVVASDPYRITPIVIEKSCWKSIDEVYWQASLLLDGLYAFSDVAGFKELYIDMLDHTTTSQRVFYGYIPNQGIAQNSGDNTTRLIAYSHAYNLANQFIPDAYRDTVEWIPSGISGYVAFTDPSVPITAFLGGALWNLTTGIKPGNILTIANWGTSTIPIRGFAWGPEVNKWQAIQEMADYCGYVFEVLYDDSSLGCAVACFCDIDDIDTYVGTPAAVTFDKGDAAKYILNVSKERRGTEMVNRVRVQGRRNKRILNFVDGITEFTAGHTVLDGLTGAEATIISCTLVSGAWGETAVGYLIISYDRTGDFVHGSTIIDTLGAGFGQATMEGNSVIYETYDEYTYSVESAAVTNLEERPRERFFALEEEFDSTDLIEAKCQAYYDMYALDPTPYSVTFRDRCDLRLWQKVKLTSFTEIPEDWMRIVSIRYTQRSGGAVEVQCTLNNALYVIAQKKMRRSLKNNDVTEIEKIVKALMAKKEVKVGTVLKVQGEGVTVQLEDGQIVVIPRAP